MTNSNKDKSKKTTKKQIDAVENLDETRGLDILVTKKSEDSLESAEPIVETKKPTKKKTTTKKTTKKVVEEPVSEVTKVIETVEKNVETPVETTVNVEPVEDLEVTKVISQVTPNTTATVGKMEESEPVDQPTEDADVDMKKKTNQKNQKPKKKGTWTKSNTIITVGIVLIMIPVLFLGWVLLDAFSGTGKLILGDRFEGDLDPAITTAQIKEIDDSLGSLEGVVDSDVILKVATLRVYVQMDQSVESEAYIDMMELVYEKVTSVLSVDSYFTLINNTKKQYDIEIHVYTAGLDYDSDEFIYFIMNKSSVMTEPNMQLYSEPLDAELAEELRQAVIDRLNPPEEEDGDIEGTDETEDSSNGSSSSEGSGTNKPEDGDGE